MRFLHKQQWSQHSSSLMLRISLSLFLLHTSQRKTGTQQHKAREQNLQWRQKQNEDEAFKNGHFQDVQTLLSWTGSTKSLRAQQKRITADSNVAVFPHSSNTFKPSHTFQTPQNIPSGPENFTLQFKSLLLPTKEESWRVTLWICSNSAVKENLCTEVMSLLLLLI